MDIENQGGTSGNLTLTAAEQEKLYAEYAATLAALDAKPKDNRGRPINSVRNLIRTMNRGARA